MCQVRRRRRCGGPAQPPPGPVELGICQQPLPEARGKDCGTGEAQTFRWIRAAGASSRAPIRPRYPPSASTRWRTDPGTSRPPPRGPLRNSFPCAASTAASNVRHAAFMIASIRRSSGGSTGAASADGRAPGCRNRSWHRRAIAQPRAKRTLPSAPGTPRGRRAARVGSGVRRRRPRPAPRLHPCRTGTTGPVDRPGERAPLSDFEIHGRPLTARRHVWPCNPSTRNVEMLNAGLDKLLAASC